jgi:NRAMP (natural resistance-associated macrophage protein)-like metal ion transporter
MNGSNKENNKRNTKTHGHPKSKFSIKSFFKIIGPGVITGASDDDPSGIATYSQAGAQLGFGMLWMVLFMFPLMHTIQEMSGRIGLVTGSGLGQIIKNKYSKKVLLSLASLLLISNIITIGADIGAMAASLRLLAPQIPLFVAILCFTIFILLSQIFIPYSKFVKVLKYITLSLFAYIATSIIVGGNIQNVLFSTFIPHIEFTKDYAIMFAAIFGTTISPYLFFWQASEEAEEEVLEGKIKEIGKGPSKEIGKKEIKMMKVDTAIGMAFSQIIMWAIIITCAGSLYSHGITNIQTAEQAAKALEPLVASFPHAGIISKSIFALGIIGTGLLGIPVLAASCGYALSDAFGWKQGLHKKFKQAKSFYLVIAVATIIGICINFTNINPIQALIYSSIINGVVALPMIVFIIKIANDKSILKDKTNKIISNIIGWFTVAVNCISIAVILFTIGR